MSRGVHTGLQASRLRDVRWQFEQNSDSVEKRSGCERRRKNSHHRYRRRWAGRVDRASPPADRAAELLIGDEPTLALAPGVGRQRAAVGGNLEAAVERISAAKSGPVVVLASGDPLFYGVARYLCDKLGKDRFEVRAARQQHAVGLCPCERELGRGVSDESGEPFARGRDREDSRRR